jgi:hypothetical protein
VFYISSPAAHISLRIRKMCKETDVAILEALSQIHLEEVRIPVKFSNRAASFWT